MRIILVVPALMHERGGIERHGSNVANFLAERGHAVCIFSCSKRVLPSVYPLHSSVLLKHYWGWDSQKHVCELRSRLLAFKPDVCVTHFSWNSVLLWQAALHGTGIPHLLSERVDPLIIENRLWNRKERLASLAGADCIHVQFSVYKNTIPNCFQHKVHVIPNGITQVEPEKFCIPHKQQKILLSLGRLETEHKQVSLLVSAFCLLASKYPQWQLHIWGTGPDGRNIKKQIAQAHMGQVILMRGLATNTSSCYQQADIFCIPSRYEGFPNALGEALAHGVPSVGFAECSGTNELIQHGFNGLLAPKMTAKSLSEQLDILMGDAVLRQQMHTHAVQSVIEYAPEKVYASWEQLIIHCLQYKGNSALQQLTNENFSHRARLAEISQRVYAHKPNSSIVFSPWWRMVAPLRFTTWFIWCVWVRIKNFLGKH